MMGKIVTSGQDDGKCQNCDIKRSGMSQWERWYGFVQGYVLGFGGGHETRQK
jgi:hypothetical protein